jgi:hypothetical protein
VSTKNDVTGDALRSRVTTDKYRDGYDAIFGKTTLDRLYDKANEEFEVDGMVSVSTLTAIINAGGDVSNY